MNVQGEVQARSGARLGLLIPAVNTESEPQFNRHAPQGMSVHVMRARIAGIGDVSLEQLRPVIGDSVDILCDARPDLIVFHCTGTSMKEGKAGDRGLIELIEARTGVAACSTIGLVVEAMQKLGMKKVVVLSPYKTNADAESYLAECGIECAASVALALKSGADYPAVTPAQWLELALQHDSADADGFFLSCTNTSQIDAIAAIEKATGKPVVNSNQAVLWGAMKRLGSRLGPAQLGPELGTLVQRA